MRATPFCFYDIHLVMGFLWLGPGSTAIGGFQDGGRLQELFSLLAIYLCLNGKDHVSIMLNIPFFYKTKQNN